MNVWRQVSTGHLHINGFESRARKPKNQREANSSLLFLGLVVIMDTILGNSLENVPLM